MKTFKFGICHILLRIYLRIILANENNSFRFSKFTKICFITELQKDNSKRVDLVPKEIIFDLEIRWKNKNKNQSVDKRIGDTN